MLVLLKLMSKNNILFRIAFYFLVAPAFIWMLFSPLKVVKEISLFPGYLKSNILSIFSEENLAKVEEARWNAFGPAKEDLPSRLFYNKGYVLVNEFFTFLTYFSPRYYFQSGDGGNFVNPKSEPVAMPLFIFWVLGLIYLVRAGKFKKICLVLVFGLITFLAGKRNFAYLFPVAILYISIALDGIYALFKPGSRKIIFAALSVYSFYILARLFLI
jgi:hypothetical protein